MSFSKVNCMYEPIEGCTASSIGVNNSRALCIVCHLHSLFLTCKVSGVSSSPELSNRERFKYYFQLCPADDELALGFFAIIRKYKWNHVAIIHQDENVFILVRTRAIKSR